MQFTGALRGFTHPLRAGAATGQLVGMMATEQTPIRLLDLRRLGIYVKELVFRVEQAVIQTLEGLGVDARRVSGAPGASCAIVRKTTGWALAVMLNSSRP